MNYDPLPRGLNVRRLRVHNHGGPQPILAYDEIDPEDYESDEEEEAEAPGPEMIERGLRAFVSKLDEEQRELVLQLLTEASGESSLDEEPVVERQSRPSGNAQDRKRAKDRRSHAMDASSDAGFYARFPNASRIVRGF